MAKRSNRSIVVSLGCPLPLYIKEQGGGRPAPNGAPPKRGILLGLQVLVGFHLKGEEREGERGGKKRGAPPPLLVQFGLGGRGARQPLGLLSSFSTRPIKAH